MSTPDPSSLDLGRAAAASLGPADWQLEAEPAELSAPEPPAEVRSTPPQPAPRAPSPEVPPPPERIIEALLFVGGPPLTPKTAAAVMRGLTAEQFHEAIERLNRSYRAQNRPYSIQPQDAGYVIALRPAHRGIREKLYGGPREARLSQPALDVLSLVAYRQPMTKADIDALRGVDSGGVLRQLVRLGLVMVSTRGEAGRHEIGYGTTPRFLELFDLDSLDELPRLAEIPT